MADELDLQNLSEEELYRLTGLEPPEMRPTVEMPQVGGGERLLAGLSGLATMPMAQPRSFGEGLAYGFGRGIGTAGARKQMEIQQRETVAQQQALVRDEANRSATERFRLERGKALKELTKQQRERRDKFRVVTEADVEAQPGLRRFLGEEKPIEWFKPPGPEGAEPLVPVETPAGPVYKRRSQAEGMPVPRTTQEPLLQVQMPDGTVAYVPRSQAVGKPPPTKRTQIQVKPSERQALAYFQRANDASETVLMKDPRTKLSLEDRVAKSGLLGQTQLQYAPNVLKTADQQAYRQAQRAFTEARLRKESGAAIPPHEYEADAKTYFAQPGDRASVIDQKRRARQVVLNGLRNAAGPAYAEFYEGLPMGTSGDEFDTPGPTGTRGRQPISDEDADAVFERVLRATGGK